jgi:hypothetical protein
MNIHANRHVVAHHSGPFGRIAAWVSARMRARRTRRMEEETIVCLSTIEPKLLNDIGVETGNLHERNPHLGVAKPAPTIENTDRRRQW